MTLASNSRPMFSILHTSARPDKWQEVYQAWMNAARHPAAVQYVLCIDSRWGFDVDQVHREVTGGFWGSLTVVVLNDANRRCYVDGVNEAARASTGRILIVNADDQYPCDSWDERLLDTLQDLPQTAALVLEVSTGTTDEHSRGIMVMPVLSRAYYDRYGCVFYPAFESMFADKDFCEQALADGCVIDARHLMFPHRHPLFDPSVRKPGVSWEQTDSVYAAQNRPEAWALGMKIIEQRRAKRQENGFTIIPSSDPRTIALCLSGEHFEGAWVDMILALYAHLVERDFRIWRLRGYSSNVYVTRDEIRKAVLELQPRPDFLLWIDDDNIVTPEQFDHLLTDLDAIPEADGVTAWCWIYDDQKKRFNVSCGMWSADHIHWQPFDPVTFPRETELRDIEVTGFPTFLMRWSAIEKAGDRPFLPILDERLPQGLTGEDLSFCASAEKGGARFFVDPRIRVEHLKYCSVVPDFVGAPESTEVQTVAAMLRVKNEARWIRRVIESLKPLTSNIFVMDDGSTDDTASESRAAGATVVYASPFAGGELNEARDKNWLLEQVRSMGDFEWIFCIDGDEELEPSGADKIRRAMSSGRAECYNVRFLYLWDAPDQARYDGVYGSMVRPSLFKNLPGYSFRSYYTDRGVHCGLHVSNAPQGLNQSPLNVWLLHYGYMERVDRLRKYEWYNSIDPHNEIEDCYRHIVQGDIPEVPAGMKLKHAGPLELRKLPAGMLASRLEQEVSA